MYPDPGVRGPLRNQSLPPGHRWAHRVTRRGRVHHRAAPCHSCHVHGIPACHGCTGDGLLRLLRPPPLPPPPLLVWLQPSGRGEWGGGGSGGAVESGGGCQGGRGLRPWSRGAAGVARGRQRGSAGRGSRGLIWARLLDAFSHWNAMSAFWAASRDARTAPAEANSISSNTIMSLSASIAPPGRGQGKTGPLRGDGAEQEMLPAPAKLCNCTASLQECATRCNSPKTLRASL